MKKLIFVCVLLLMSTIAFAQQTVFEETAYNNSGQLFVRLVNQSNQWVSCYYRDQYNYYTFSIAPQTITQWQPIYGAYVWECRYY